MVRSDEVGFLDPPQGGPVRLAAGHLENVGLI